MTGKPRRAASAKDAPKAQRLAANAEIRKVYDRLGLSMQADRDRYRALGRPTPSGQRRYVTRLAASSESPTTR